MGTLIAAKGGTCIFCTLCLGVTRMHQVASSILTSASLFRQLVITEVWEAMPYALFMRPPQARRRKFVVYKSKFQRYIGVFDAASRAPLLFYFLCSF